MELLRCYLNSQTPDEQAAFAVACGSTIGYLRKALSVRQPLGACLCVAIELQTQRAVRRWDLRPADWHRLWPELIGTPGAPDVPDQEAAA